jgi:hypothetical protein
MRVGSFSVIEARSSDDVHNLARWRVECIVRWVRIEWMVLGSCLLQTYSAGLYRSLSFRIYYVCKLKYPTVIGNHDATVQGVGFGA